MVDLEVSIWSLSKILNIWETMAPLPPSFVPYALWEAPTNITYNEMLL